MVEPYFCDKCNFETDQPIANCQVCGTPLRKTSTIRKLGWVLVVLGGVLTMGMVYLTYVVSALIERADDPGSGARFTGDSSDATMIYGIFGVVIALSITFVIAGIWQIVYGRRNKKLVFVALVLAGVFYALGEYVQNFW